MLDDLLVNSAIIKRYTWSNVKGVKTRVLATSETRSVSVQPMRVDQQTLYESERGVTFWTAYTATDPLVRAGDELSYAGRVLAVLGPARDQAGRAEVWAIDCSEAK